MSFVAVTTSGGAGPLMIAAALAVPMLMLAACCSRTWRQRLPSTLAFAPLPALVASLTAFDGAAIVVDETRLQVSLALDPLRAILLGTVALLWMTAGAYATRYLKDDPLRVRFAVYWLLSLIGCLGVFMAADLGSFYLLYAIVSLAAYGLVVHDGTPAARRAAVIYIALAVLGEACLLLAFVLLASQAPGESLLIRDVVAALPTSRLADQTLVFLVLGFGLKVGLVPLHGWLPLAHPAAPPMPASAVLSGAIIKTGVIGFVVFLPLDAAMPSWGTALTIAGFATAFYAVLVGITQSNPKTVLAYSSVSQMGIVVALLGVGLNGGAGEHAAFAATFYAAHHVLVKGALFLGVGVFAVAGPRRRLSVLLPTAIVALSLAGLPLTGGALAKLATKPFLSGNALGPLATLSAIGSALLMTHFMGRFAAARPDHERAAIPAGLIVPWVVTVIAAIAVPWALFRFAIGEAPAMALDGGEVWSALWPVLVGATLALIVRRSAVRFPQVPEGDILCVGERWARAIAAGGAVLEPIDRAMRRWSVAGVALAALTIALSALILRTAT